jgi:signal transduction histidine kinase
MQRIEGAVQMMERLFVSLLDISKLDSGAVQPNVEEVDVDLLFSRLEETWAPQAFQKGLTLRVRRSGYFVRSDALLLEQIFNNLVSNAIRYTERGGILLACRRRHADSELQIWDTGSGISRADTELIFDEFFRAPTTDPAVSGNGLGLAISRRIAHMLGGDISLSDAPDHGSIFTLALPISH